jgi:molybdopterin-guanine dinucleotide biosynthesis protein A
MAMDAGRAVGGYVLAGGASRRMGTAKALLPFRGRTLIGYVAGEVSMAAGNVTIVGRPELYAGLGLAAIADELPGFGPLGGLLTALRSSTAEWSLVVACDLPRITAAFLRELIDAGLSSPGAKCVVAKSERGVEPLCAVWNARAIPELRCALESGCLKMKGVVELVQAREWPVADPQILCNINAPEDWASVHD